MKTVEITCQTKDYMPLDSLVTFQGELKKLKKENRDKLKKSILKYGFTAPIFVWGDKLLDGHQRTATLKYMRDEGYEVPDLPVVKIHAIDEKEAKEKLLHITSQYGEFTEEGIQTFIFESDLDFDIVETIRLTDSEISIKPPVEETEDDDEVDDDVPAITQLGDLWQLGEHRLLCGDSTDKESVEYLMGGKKADMVFTDPPYGISEKGDRSKRKGDKSLSDGVEYKSFIDDSIEYAIKAFRICEELNIPRQVWWGANYYAHHVPQTNNWFVWDKRVEEKQKDTQSDCELAWVKSKYSSVRIFRHLWKGLIKDSENGIGRVHPTQKPIALAEWCFSYYENANNILDLFLGSGTTLIAAEKTNRKCYGMELDPHYCDVIVKRYVNWCRKNNHEISTVMLNGEVYDYTDLLEVENG